jgi:hypothetical protein
MLVKTPADKMSLRDGRHVFREIVRIGGEWNWLRIVSNDGF